MAAIDRRKVARQAGAGLGQPQSDETQTRKFKEDAMTCFRMLKTRFQTRISRGTLFAVTAVGLTFGVSTANAACGGPAGSRPGIPANLSFLAQGNSQAQTGEMNASIVGLWQVTYTAGGQLFYQAFDQWHSDHTEFENADVPAIIGNVCMGAWKTVGTRTYKLNHVGWNFDNTGNPDGTFTLTETIKVRLDGSAYHGNFDYKLYDANGNLLQEIMGTLAAKRITAD